MKFFTRRSVVFDISKAPYETYLYIECDNGFTREVYEISDDAPLDIDELVREVFKDFSDIKTVPEYGGSNYAAIITDSRAPDCGIVWSSRNFYFLNDD